MNTLEIELFLRRLPRPYWAALGLGLVSLTLLICEVIFVEWPLHASQALLQKTSHEADAPVSPDSDQGDVSRLRAFSDILVPNDSGSTALRPLFDLALASGIHLARGDYQVESETGGVYRRFIIALPVSGTYHQVRSFAFAALGKDPALALSDITFRREQPGVGLISATVRFTLYQRAGR